MEDEYNEYGSCEEIFKKKIDIKTNKTGYFKLTIIATGGEYGYGIVEDKNKIDIIKNKIKNEDETISSCFYECDKQFVYQYGPSIQESHILLSVYKDEECQDEIDELVYYEDIDNISLNIFEKSNPFITEDIKKECSKDAIEFGGYYIEKRIHFPVVIHIKDDEIFDINNIYIGTVNMDETLSNDEIVDSVFYIRPVVAKKIIQLYKGENNIKEDESLSDYICDIYNDIENNQEIKKILSLCECEVLEVEGKGAKEEQYAILKTLDNKILFNDYI